MKLRIKGNSIRLRLTRPEVGALVERGVVAEETRFADGAVLGYRVVSDAVQADGAEPGALFVDGVVTVRLPAAVVGRWARENIVGLEHVELLKGGGELRILVEKDFECLQVGNPESDAGAYPNPGRGGGDAGGGVCGDGVEE